MSKEPHMKILLVDDSFFFLNALQALLLEAGYRNIVMKQSADEAVKYLQSSQCRPPGKHVDVILMDVVMPKMDGIEAVRRIKAIEGLRDIPILMVSALDDDDKIERAFEAGAIDYIAKPLKKVELRARIRSVLKLKEEMDHRKAHEKELEKTVRELQQALDHVKTLNGMLPICSFCKKIRDDKGYWQQVEKYVSARSDVGFSHGICPDCLRSQYPDQAERVLQKTREKDKKTDKKEH